MSATVVALGGHVLADDTTLRDPLAALLDGRRLVLTHGNGPQVGEELLRAPETPVHVAVARTQGELGAVLAAELDAVCVVTRVVVDESDPAFAEPTKPIGPSYDEVEARRLAREHGWRVDEEAGRGWRRVVPSPGPREILELGAIRALAEAGRRVVACGGGGVPVVRRNGRLAGVDAVIDKDRASALLAAQLHAALLVVLTDVDAVYRDYRTSSEHVVSELTPEQADAMARELPAGSMRPKVQACAAFVRAGGGEALVTSPAALADALEGRAGTRIRLG